MKAAPWILVMAMAVGTALPSLRAGEPAPLRYRLEPGRVHRYRVVTETAPPVISGARPFRTELSVEMEATGRHPRNLLVRARGESSREEIQAALAGRELTMELAAGLRGMAADWQGHRAHAVASEGDRASPDLEHPIRGALLQSLTRLLTPLPGSEPEVGDAFEVESTLHNPELSIPGSFRRLPVVSRFVYEGRLDWSGRSLEVFAVRIVHAREGSRELDVRGEVAFDTTHGRVERFEVRGVLRTYQELFLGMGKWFSTEVSILAEATDVVEEPVVRVSDEGVRVDPSLAASVALARRVDLLIDLGPDLGGFLRGP